MKQAVAIITFFIVLLIAIYGWNVVIVKDEDCNQNSEMNNADKVAYVDEQIRQLIVSDVFKAAALDTRKKLAQELLKQLKKDDLITHYNFQKNSQMFSFTYCDGTQGGVLLENRDPYFNG